MLPRERSARAASVLSRLKAKMPASSRPEADTGTEDSEDMNDMTLPSPESMMPVPDAKNNPNIPPKKYRKNPKILDAEPEEY